MAENASVTLREYLEEKQKAMGELMLARLDALNSILDLRLVSISDATKIYKTTTDERLGHMNQFREENKDLISRFPTRELFDSYIKQQQEVIQRLEEKIDALESTKDKMQGMASQKSVTFTQLFTVVTFLLALIGLILRFS